jgi:hypothetical protein
MQKCETYYRYEFKVERAANGHITTEVIRPGNKLVLQLTQHSYNFEELEARPEYQHTMTQNLREFLRQVYASVAPRWIENLKIYVDTEVNARPIQCGAHVFQCGKEALFAGVVEVVYQMRNSLFHGELIPTKEAISCYEPAYRLVRRFLECVS